MQGFRATKTLSIRTIETKWLGDHVSSSDSLGEGLCRGEKTQKRLDTRARFSRCSCKALAGRFLVSACSSYESSSLAPGWRIFLTRVFGWDRIRLFLPTSIMICPPISQRALQSLPWQNVRIRAFDSFNLIYAMHKYSAACLHLN